MDVLRRLSRKSMMERIKNEHIKKIMGVKGKPDVIDITEKKRLQWFGHIKRMPEERISKLIIYIYIYIGLNHHMDVGVKFCRGSKGTPNMPQTTHFALILTNFSDQTFDKHYLN